MIQLKKNLMRYNNGLETSHKEYFETEVESIVPYLTEEIEIDPDYTLGDLFAYLEKDEMVLDIIFASCMGGFKLKPYIEEIKKECLPESQEDMECIECIWVAEQFDYKVFYENRKNDTGGLIHILDREPLREPDEYDVNDIEIYVDVSGTGSDADGNVISYAIEFTPLYRLKHLAFGEYTNGKPVVQFEKVIIGERHGEWEYAQFEIILNENVSGNDKQQKQNLFTKI